MDLNMPTYSGVEVNRQIKQFWNEIEFDSSLTKVVIHSALNNINEIGEAAGEFNGQVDKPISHARLREKLKEFVPDLVREEGV